MADGSGHRGPLPPGDGLQGSGNLPVGARQPEAAAPERSALGRSAAFAAHLRLPMQLVLAPIYLLGAFATGRPAEAGWLLPFAAVHVALYGGATAFNSYHDRDTGPIAFRKRPRAVSAGEMRAAIALQLAGVAVLAARSLTAGGVAAIMFLMGVGYSHPRWRWKRSAVASLVAVAAGQGAGAFALGYTTAAGTAGTGGLGGAGGGLDPLGFGMATAGVALATAGLYPITQVYQVDEDRRRGDETLPVRIGWRPSLFASLLLTSAGTWLLARAFGGGISGGWRTALIVAPALLAVVLAAWSARFETQTIERRHDWAMSIAALASVFFLAFAWLGLRR